LIQGDAICFCGLFEERTTLHSFTPLSKNRGHLLHPYLLKVVQGKERFSCRDACRDIQENVFVAVLGGQPLASGKLKKQKKETKHFEL
jgi:hypothetical protein